MLHDRKNILVCGAGSIGLRHIRNLLNLDTNVFVYRKRKDKIDELKNEFGSSVEIVSSLNSRLDHFDGMIVATETSNHREIVEIGIANSLHLYIEKPIDINSHNLLILSEEIIRKNLVVEVGCQLRKHPCLIRLKEILSKQNIDLYTCNLSVWTYL